ncbi:MAG TPA: RHS repeat-associated core domain-containing protein, partial [Sediminibacterium sp.]|nr:RHS repeat-associated core domain-containing protein [Sediminibacterium sp.]
IMPQRSMSSGSYRYGFNGKENDNEVKGNGNHLDYGARVYDSRLGRWFSVDKIIKPSFSSYQFAKGNPINFIDPDGNDEIHFYYKLQENFDGSGKVYTTITISTQIIQNGNKNHSFFIHNKTLGSLDGAVVQLKPFINGTNLPNQSSFAAAEKGLPLAPVTKYLFGLAKNYTDDYEYLGRILQVDPTALEHYRNDNQWSWALNGAKAQATTAEFAKKLVGKSELVFAIIDGYYALRGLYSTIRSLPFGFKSAGDYNETLQAIKGASGVDDAIVGIRGSRVTGTSFSSGEAVTAASDYDFFIVSDKLFNEVAKMGVSAKDGALKVSATLKIPALANLEKELGQKLGSKATIRIFSQEGFEKTIKKGAYATGTQTTNVGGGAAATAASVDDKR